MRAHHLSLILSLAVLPACEASAQTLPWPTDPPRPGGVAAMPATPGMLGAPAPMPGSVAPPGGFATPAPLGGAPPPCLVEFSKMREDVEKKGRATKELTERKPSRDEMCKQITAYATAEAKWVKFTEGNVASCGIPREIAQQLKTAHSRTEEARTRICSGGPAGAPPAPSLSDALGTAQLPITETAKPGGGSMFDTLTGNVLQR